VRYAVRAEWLDETAHWMARVATTGETRLDAYEWCLDVTPAPPADPDDLDYQE